MSMPKVCPYCGGHVGAGLTECPSCHKPLTNRADDALSDGTMLAERYMLVRCLGRDGEGILYAAKDKTSGLSLVIKEYFPVTLSEPRKRDNCIEPQIDREVAFKTTAMDFEDLYRTLQQVTPATGLTAVLDVVKENHTVYAVMEQPRGRTLSWYLHGRKPMRPAEARSILQPVMEGAAALHKAGLIHRGISPDTIYITRDGAASLCGYATLALRSKESELKPQLFEGYMAPEQYDAAEFDGRYTDVYSIAAVAYRLVTGQVPVAAPQRKLRDSLEPAEEFSSDIPAYFSQVLEYAMQLDPKERVQNVPELMGMLASAATANSMMGKRKRNDRNHISTKNILMTAIIVIFILVLLLAWCVLRLTGGTPAESVSAAPTPTAEPEQTEELLLPDFVGKRLSEVQYDRNYTAFRFSIEEEFSNDVPPKSIIRQEPDAGTDMTGTIGIVRLIVSKGPKLATMPRIIGFTQENAVAVLNENGIQFSLLMLANNGEYAAGCVARVDMPEGTQFDPTERIINVYIAAERDNTAALTYEQYEEYTEQSEQPEQAEQED